MKTYRMFMLCIAATVAAAACQKETTAPEAPVKMVKVSFTASMADTKTSVDGLKMTWSAGDVIGITESVKSATIYPFTTETGGAEAVFTGELPDGFTAGKAIYPYDESVVNSSAANFQVSTPNAKQTAVKGSISPNTSNLWAAFDDITAGTVTFHHACAYLKVNVAGSDVSSIKLETNTTSTTDTKLQGSLALPDGKKANVSTTSGVSSTSNGVKYVTLSSGSALAAGSYYATILATSTNERILTDLTITYTKTDGTRWTRTTTKPITILPGAVYTLPGDETACEQLTGGPDTIADAEDFVCFIQNIDSYEADDVVNVTADIDLAGKTNVTSSGTFLGTLDGQNHLIKNLSTNKYLFKTIGEGAVVKNLTFGSSCILEMAPASSMGFIAYENKGELSGCVNNADITYESTASATMHTGVFLGINRNYVHGCVNNGDVTITANAAVSQIRFGGILGSNAESLDGIYPVVEDCTNNGNISFTQLAGTNNGDKYISGIVAVQDSEDDSFVTGCTNYGTISANGADNENKLYPGGITGLLKGGIIKNCNNFGSVSSNSSAAFVGGLVSALKFGKPDSGKITSFEGCAVNCTVSGPAANTGMVIGNMTSASKFTFGTEAAPVKVAGTINGVTIDSSNYAAYTAGSAIDLTSSDHEMHAVYEAVAR